MQLDQIHVRSSDIDLGEAIVNKARESILDISAKYFGQLENAHVHFRREGEFFACSVNIKSGKLPTDSAEALNRDPYVAFKMALDKVAKQMRRHKRELREDKAVRVDKTALLDERVSEIGSRKAFVYPDMQDD